MKRLLGTFRYPPPISICLDSTGFSVNGVISDSLRLINVRSPYPLVNDSMVARAKSREIPNGMRASFRHWQSMMKVQPTRASTAFAIFQYKLAFSFISDVYLMLDCRRNRRPFGLSIPEVLIESGHFHAARLDSRS